MRARCSAGLSNLVCSRRGIQGRTRGGEDSAACPLASRAAQAPVAWRSAGPAVWRAGSDPLPSRRWEAACAARCTNRPPLGCGPYPARARAQLPAQGPAISLRSAHARPGRCAAPVPPRHRRPASPPRRPGRPPSRRCVSGRDATVGPPSRSESLGAGVDSRSLLARPRGGGFPPSRHDLCDRGPACPPTTRLIIGNE
jgi:hypothetical protein